MSKFALLILVLISTVPTQAAEVWQTIEQLHSIDASVTPADYVHSACVKHNGAQVARVPSSSDACCDYWFSDCTCEKEKIPGCGK